jgi:hypothetical protein
MSVPPCLLIRGKGQTIGLTSTRPPCAHLLVVGGVNQCLFLHVYSYVARTVPPCLLIPCVLSLSLSLSFSLFLHIYHCHQVIGIMQNCPLVCVECGERAPAVVNVPCWHVDWCSPCYLKLSAYVKDPNSIGPGWLHSPIVKCARCRCRVDGVKYVRATLRIMSYICGHTYIKYNLFIAESSPLVLGLFWMIIARSGGHLTPSRCVAVARTPGQT